MKPKQKRKGKKAPRKPERDMQKIIKENKKALEDLAKL
jgi:hypothetical protein